MSSSILVSCQDLAKAYHARPLFDGLSFGVFEQDRLGIIGANGAGKSTLLRILAGLEEPDSGQVAARRGLRTAYVPQVATFPETATARDVVEAAGRTGGLPADQLAIQVPILLGQIGLDDPDVKVGILSGGWKKRISLACGLILEPELLLLDEPTNHLDSEGVWWLEDTLKNAPFAWIMVSHDRYMLERTVTRVGELSRLYPNGVLIANGRYSDFIEKRLEYQAQQTSLSESLSNKARREVEWLRRGPQARTTKAKYRVDQTQSLLDELSNLKERLSEGGKAKLDFTGTERKSRRLLVAEEVTLSRGGRCLIKDLSLVLMPGTRVALMGGNGTGKTTILRALVGETQPDAGEIRRVEGLRVVYFDQNRARLDPDMTLRRTWCDGGDAVIFRDRQVHVATWAKRFNFSPAQLDVPVGELSGGEQARALIAKLMLEPADVLLLDEPTNDLDIPTLEALEESLNDFPGAIVLVSHDRYLVDQIANVIVGLNGDGGHAVYADLDQWDQAMRERVQRKRRARPETPSEPRPEKTRTPSKRLSYMEQREFDRIESDIQMAEQQLEEKRAAAQDPAISTNAASLQQAYKELQEAEDKVEKLYARWAELEAKQK